MTGLAIFIILMAGYAMLWPASVGEWLAQIRHGYDTALSNLKAKGGEHA